MLDKNCYIKKDRKFDLICLGRLAVDLYAQQIGAPLEEVSSFAKYLGGSSGNVAFGTARLGLKTAMLSCVGDDQMGNFLLNSLSKEGCDVSHIKKTKDHLTAITLLGIKDQNTFPLLFYRENCADMSLTENDIDEKFIASSHSLAITGTHFSQKNVYQASLKALNYAQKNNVLKILDIDYRPVLWGLTNKSDGETRFIANNKVSEHLQSIAPLFDLIVGTEEEFCILGGNENLFESLKFIRKINKGILVLKLGAKGCTIFENKIPNSFAECEIHEGVKVDVLNVLGAGDAFLSGFLANWLRNKDLKTCCHIANACGALVVSRHSCAPAMPTWEEINYFLNHKILKPSLDVELKRLHRVTIAKQKWDELFIFAFDHRIQFMELAHNANQPEVKISELKKLFVTAVIETESELNLQGKIGILADDQFGQEALNLATGRGWWIGRPVELPLSNPLQFEKGSSIGSHLLSWPKDHIIKCLVQYHPDDEVQNRIKQEKRLLSLYHAAQISGHELLIEIIPPKIFPHAQDTVYRSMKNLYNLGIFPEWWKLEQPSFEIWPFIDELIAKKDPYCRGVVLLGLNEPLSVISKGFKAAYHSKTCRGFAIGRTIFYEASKQWFNNEISNREVIKKTGDIFKNLIQTWQNEKRNRI